MAEIYPGVSVDPAFAHGKPVLTGTRIPVTLVLGHLAAGDSIEDVCNVYLLTPDQVRAAFGYAADVLGHESVYVTAQP